MYLNWTATDFNVFFYRCGNERQREYLHLAVFIEQQCYYFASKLPYLESALANRNLRSYNYVYKTSDKRVVRWNSTFRTNGRKWDFASPRLCFMTETKSRVMQNSFGRGTNTIFHQTPNKCLKHMKNKQN